jgi:hypothetical protein
MRGFPMATTPASFKKDGPAKKPYESPRLEVYGDIREVTDAVNPAGAKSDGSLHANNKT